MGTVRFFDHACGFGFIENDADGTDVYVHISAVEQSGLRGLIKGQRMIYDIVTDGRSGRTAAAFLRCL